MSKLFRKRVNNALRKKKGNKHKFFYFRVCCVCVCVVLFYFICFVLLRLFLFCFSLCFHCFYFYLYFGDFPSFFSLLLFQKVHSTVTRVFKTKIIINTGNKKSDRAFSFWKINFISLHDVSVRWIQLLLLVFVIYFFFIDVCSFLFRYAGIGCNIVMKFHFGLSLIASSNVIT